MQHYFVDIKENNKFYFDKETSHHIINVMRKKDGEEVICVYKGEFYLTNLKIEQKNVEAIIVEKQENAYGILAAGA